MVILSQFNEYGVLEELHEIPWVAQLPLVVSILSLNHMCYFFSLLMIVLVLEDFHK